MKSTHVTSVVAIISLCLLLVFSSCGQTHVPDSRSDSQQTAGDTATLATTGPSTASPTPATTRPASSEPAATGSAPASSGSTQASREPTVSADEPAATTTRTSTAATTTAATTATAAATAATTEGLTAQADALHHSARVMDTHCDTVLKIIDTNTWLPKINIASKTSFMVDIPKLQAGGIDLQVFASYTSGYALTGGGQDFAQANSRLLALLNAVRWTVDMNPKSLRAIRRYSDIDAAVRDGRIGILSSIEGAYSFNDANGIELLRQYHDLGVRMLSLTWNYANALGEGVNETYRDGSASSGGLTGLGRDVVAEMNRLGMIVDVSHLNEATFWDVMDASRAPVIASHSSVYALCPNARNLKDEQILAIAAAGGVIQVNYHRPFLAADSTSVTIGTLVDHIDAIVSLAGIEAVGLGSDFDGAKMPKGLEDASKVPAITLELLNRGYSETAIRQILGGNTARLIEDVLAWAVRLESSSGAPDIAVQTETGTGVSSDTPVLTAIIRTGADQTLDPDSLKVILDGIACQPDFDAATGTASLAVTAPLTGKFHVVTFIAAHMSGETARETVIFYID